MPSRLPDGVLRGWPTGDNALILKNSCADRLVFHMMVGAIAAPPSGSRRRGAGGEPEARVLGSHRGEVGVRGATARRAIARPYSEDKVPQSAAPAGVPLWKAPAWTVFARAGQP
jgi:hypothetical protein